MGPPTSKWHVGSPNSLWGHPIPPAATGMGPGGNALRCTLGTQREPSHALRWPWGHPPPNGMWGHPTLCGVTQTPPAATGMGPGVLMLVAWHWCTTMVLVACVAPSCLWHGATHPQVVWGHPTPPAATGMGPQMLMLVAWHWCTTMVLVACAAPSCLWHGASQLKVVWGHPTPPAATGIGATQLPQLPCHL